MERTPEQLEIGILSHVINSIIFAVTLALVISFFREDGKWSPARGKRIFRNFKSHIIHNLIINYHLLQACTI